MHWLSDGPLRYVFTRDRFLSPLLATLAAEGLLLYFLGPHPYVLFPVCALVYLSVQILAARIKERRDMDRGLRDAIRDSQGYGRGPDLMPGD